MSTLITFDVDGTLIESVGENSNALHKEAFTAAYKQVFGIDTHIDVIKHHGGTDPLILIKVLVDYHGLDKQDVLEKLKDMEQVMVNYFDEHQSRAGEGLQLLPGVKALLQALKERRDVKVGLVTGNLEPIGWAKMRALGIEHLFSDPQFGGFGSDYCSGNCAEMWHDRCELIKIAERKAGGGFTSRYHVGDTPFDVLAAAQAGAVAVGVVTGVFSERELREAVPHCVVAQNLSCVNSALKIFGLE